MKKISLIFLLLCSLFFESNSQSLTFTLLKPPCKQDGILVVNLPVSDTAKLTWYYNAKTIEKSGIVNKDTISDYAGGPVSVFMKTNQGFSTYGGYKSDLPFTYNILQTLDTCPKPSLLEVTTLGGTAPFTYQWYREDNGIKTLVGNTNPVGVGNGTYSVVVTDANGCMVGSNLAGTQPNLVYVKSPVSFTYDLITTPANCTNGSIVIENIAGGKQPFSFQWSNGATSQSLTNLMSGNFQMTITDADGCYDVEYEAYVPQAYDIPVNITSTPPTCSNNDGSAIAFVSGGKAPYTYNWSNGASTQQIDQLVSGSYLLNVTDADGCFGSGYAFLAPISPVIVSIEYNKASSCSQPTGSAKISVSGGTPPYTISWNTFPQQSGALLQNVPSGVYNFTVHDDAGCIRTGNVMIAPESVLSAGLSVSGADCNASNGSISLSVTGGTAPYTYLWNTGTTTSDVTAVPAGTYIVTVTDAKACKLVKAAHVNKQTPLSAGLSTVPASCIFEADGSASVNVFNGTAPYTYNWNNGASTNVITNLKEGKYYVFIEDANGCQLYKELTVSYNSANDDCYCIIEGTVFEDANTDCARDKTEKGIKNIQVYCSGIGYTYTDSTGKYSFKVPSGTYTITENGNDYYPLAPCQPKQYTATAVAADACRITFDFANVKNVIHDVRIKLWNANIPVPGFKYAQNLVLSNDGTLDESVVVAAYKNDNQVGVPIITPGIFDNPAAGYFTNNTSISLKPGESQNFSLDYSVPTNIPLQTELYFTDSTSYEAPMSNWLNDFTPWNNVHQLRTTVVGSFDPNFIEVSPQGLTDKGYISLQDTVLEYMVHFQNTGNYFANKVKVDVILDPNLDWPSLAPGHSSFPAEILLSESGVLTYTFDNIHLYPESWNKALSKGFFIFSVRQKPDLTKGDEIKNYADIYFDYNAAVQTNSTLNTIDYRLNTESHTSNEMVKSIYPNPSNGTVFVQLNDVARSPVSVRVVDFCGRIVALRDFDQGTSILRLDTHHLQSGIYFVEVTSGQAAKSIKKLILLHD